RSWYISSIMSVSPYDSAPNSLSLHAALPILPVVLPSIWVAATVCPLNGRRKVANDRVEPHVEFLRVIICPALNRDRNSPVNIAGHGARAHVLNKVEREF